VKYVRKAMSEPIDASPPATRFDPNHTTAAHDALMISRTVGNMNDISRPALSDVSVTCSFTKANRSTSCGSRTNARTTRMPVICSRSTRLMPSMRSCMRRNVGTIRSTI
jgi:hypothetical protein